MKVAFLSTKENVELQKALKMEYVRLDYVCFVNDILFRMNNHDATTTIKLCDELLFILNKILLDNIFRYIANRIPNNFLFLLSNNTFSKDIYVNPFYVSQIIDSTGLYIEDKTELENIITSKLQVYIDRIYMTNTDCLNILIMNVFDVMYRNLQHINISYYKFELMNYQQPILLYSEQNHYEESLCI